MLQVRVQMVMISEVEMSLAVLNRDLSLSSVFPHFERFTVHHREALRHGVTEVLDKLNDVAIPRLLM